MFIICHEVREVLKGQLAFHLPPVCSSRTKKTGIFYEPLIINDEKIGFETKEAFHYFEQNIKFFMHDIFKNYCDNIKYDIKHNNLLVSKKWESNIQDFFDSYSLNIPFTYQETEMDNHTIVYSYNDLTILFEQDMKNSFWEIIICQ